MEQEKLPPSSKLEAVSHNQIQPNLQQNFTPVDTCKQYDKIRVLGKGSYGVATVYRRRVDWSLVVLKEIDLQKFKGDREKEAAINEARIMSTLNHVNIIRYHNAYTTDTKLIIEMEYASIGTLAAYMSFQIQPFEEQEILIIFRQIASGLKYLHSKNIVHLDLKMANIFVTVEGLIKIGDFSISQYMENNQHQQQQFKHSKQKREKNSNHLSGDLNLKQPYDKHDDNHSAQLHLNLNKKFTNSHLGTIAYSSPERCFGDSTDFKSDIWSLGCILYELITTKTLFTGDCLPELVLNITRIQYQPIKRNITPALKEIFEKTIARDPGHRPSAQELFCATGQLLSRQNQLNRKNKLNNKCQNNRFDLSTEVALLAAHNQDDMSQINYPHSLVYQVSLDSRNIHLDRVNLPQTKRIKEISKGKSHYLVLTYDSIVYGWGARAFGQLGACGLTSSLNKEHGMYHGVKFKSSKNGSESKELLFQANSSSATSSLASSTQTIANTMPTPSSAINRSTTSINNHQHQSTSRELVMEMLNNLPPATRPFVINELNHRKIIQVAAGHNFSVFLSRTGIVMTCGDGSTGCLGRGDLNSCFTPCMVESLLNNDVVSIACGPKHVVAVCGNGRAFAWGKIRHGGLGLGFGSGLLNNKRDSNLKSVLDPSGRYVLIPQQVKFIRHKSKSSLNLNNADIFIKSVYCGDKCTIFIDSENHCWACGENRFNKLGLDIKRRFRKTLLVERSYMPVEVSALNKYEIVNCNIGKNHSSFITSDGKLIILGQDLDHTYRLKSNIVCARDSHRRISFQLQTNRKRRDLQALDGSRASYSRHFSDSLSSFERARVSTRRTSSTISNKQLMSIGRELIILKTDSDIRLYKGGKNNNIKQTAPSKRLTKNQLSQWDNYIKKSRLIRKIPLGCDVIGVSCNSRFTLALTSDNHVYFWGTRSYKNDYSDSYSTKPHRCKSCIKKRSTTEPQLVASCSDECFIKIGATNNSLMKTIEVLGSDQPIIHAQDPRLKANSLADLWILDYKPSLSSTSTSSTCSSVASSITGLNSSFNSSCSSFDSTCSICCSSQSKETLTRLSEIEADEEDCMKHAAILEPQSIVSLYIPSMFNHHNGCALNLVDLFCFDEDRFYLILDTTIKVQSNNTSFKHKNHNTTNNNQCVRSLTHQPATATKTINHTKPLKDSQLPNQQHLVLPKYDFRDKDFKIDESETSSPKTYSHIINTDQSGQLFGMAPENHNRKNMDTISAKDLVNSEEIRIYVNEELANNQQIDLQSDDGAENSIIVPCDDNNNNLEIYHQHIDDNNEPNLASSSQGGGVSIEEPRSLSTFANSLGNHVIVGPSMRVLDPDQHLKPLNFNTIHQQQTSLSDSLSNSASSVGLDNNVMIDAPNEARLSATRRTKRILMNGSESTTACNDDTSLMPDWVKNEYYEYQQNQEINIEECASETERIGESSEIDETILTDNSSISSSVTIRSEINKSINDQYESLTECYETQPKDFHNETKSLGIERGVNHNSVIRQNLEEEQERDFPDHNISLSSNDHSMISFEKFPNNLEFTDGRVKGNLIFSNSTKSPSIKPSKNLISRSQPDISEVMSDDDGIAPDQIGDWTRRASIINEVQEKGAGCGVEDMNILDCNVYKAINNTNYLSLYQSSNYNATSEFSSRSNSHNPLVKPETIGSNTSAFEQKLSSAYFNGELQSNDTTIAQVNNRCANKINKSNTSLRTNGHDTVTGEYQTSNRSLEEKYQSMKTNETMPRKHDQHKLMLGGLSQVSNLSQSLSQLRQPAMYTSRGKVGSSLSLASLRRSLIKLFC